MKPRILDICEYETQFYLDSDERFQYRQEDNDPLIFTNK